MRTVPRARLICRQVTGNWELVIEAETGFSVGGDTSDAASGANTEFRPTDFKEGAIVADEAGRQVEQIQIYVDQPMVFRLGNDWQGDGRKVGSIGVGHFVVIVPSNWRRLGAPPVAPEPCIDSGFLAHYFHRGRDDPKAVKGFVDEYEREHDLSSSVIELVGKCVHDTSEQGELFVGKPPVLKARGMAWARVGEEGTSRWGENFRLDGERSLGDILNGREGWFFVRVYAAGRGVAADSAQFRYFADLREIRVAGNNYGPDTLLMPEQDGHRAVDVEVVCGDGSEVEVSGSSGTRKLETQDRTVVCPADRDLNEVCCQMKGVRGEVDVVVELPWVWWGLARGGEGPQPWLDTAQTVTRAEFQRLAREGAKLWIDVPNAIRRVRVGFDDEIGSSYLARKADERHHSSSSRWHCTVPLKDYLYHSQIDQRLFQNAVLVADFAKVNVDLMCVAADPPPRVVEFVVEPDRVTPSEVVVVRWTIEDCDGVAVSLVHEPSDRLGPPRALLPNSCTVPAKGACELPVEHRTVVTLELSAPGMKEVREQCVIEVEGLDPEAIEPVPIAKRVAGWRTAKGFSKGEVSSVPGAENLSLRIDRRRRSVHRRNVEGLERCVNETR